MDLPCDSWGGERRGKLDRTDAPKRNAAQLCCLMPDARYLMLDTGWWVAHQLMAWEMRLVSKPASGAMASQVPRMSPEGSIINNEYRNNQYSRYVERHMLFI